MAQQQGERRASSEAPARWPEPRLRALQVEEFYRYAPLMTAASFFGALLTLGVLIENNDIGRGAVWFLWATAVTFFRSICIVSYRRRNPESDPEAWGRLMIAANLLAGVQWGLLGTLLFPDSAGYLQLFILMVIVCFVGGSVTGYAALKGAHEALSIPATIPSTIYIFFVQSGVHLYAGTMALFFSLAIIYFGRRLHRHLERGFRLQIERDDLLTLTAMLNEKLERENKELAHRVAVRGVTAEHARERADRLEALFERPPLPQLECDSAGNIIMGNPAAERLFGLRHQDLAGRPLASLLAIPGTQLKALTSTRDAEILGAEALGREGLRVPCTASFTPLPAAEGGRAGFAVILTGIPVAVA